MARAHYISDAEDILHDIERRDLAERGQITKRKRASIRRMCEAHGFSSDWIARQLNLSVDDVEQEIADIHSSAPSPR